MLFPRRVCFHTAPSAKSCLLATRNEAKTQLRIGPIQLRRVSLKAYHQVRSGCPNKFPTDFLSNIPPQYLQIPITGSWQRLCLVNFGKESGWQMRKWNRLKTPGWIERKRYYSFIIHLFIYSGAAMFLKWKSLTELGIHVAPAQQILFQQATSWRIPKRTWCFRNISNLLDLLKGSLLTYLWIVQMGLTSALEIEDADDDCRFDGVLLGISSGITCCLCCKKHSWNRSHWDPQDDLIKSSWPSLDRSASASVAWWSCRKLMVP